MKASPAAVSRYRMSLLGCPWGSDQSPLFSLSIPGTCVFLPWEWIIESSHWISSKPQTNPSHSLSLNSRFPPLSPLAPVSSYWVKIIAPFRLWVCLRRRVLRGQGSRWMKTSNIWWLSCWRWRRIFYNYDSHKRKGKTEAQRLQGCNLRLIQELSGNSSHSGRKLFVQKGVKC